MLKAAAIQVGLLLCIQNYAFSSISNCSDKILETSNRELEKRIDTPSYQGRQGWCHSYVAADLLSWYLEKSVSAIHLGIKSSDMISSNIALRHVWPRTKDELGSNYGEYRGGKVSRNLKNSADMSICLEEDLPSNHLEYTQSQPYKEVLYKLNLINSALKEEPIDSDLMEIVTKLPGYKSNNSFMKNLSQRQVNIVVFDNRELGAREILKKLISMNCSNSIRVPRDLKYAKKSLNRSGLNKLNELIDNNQPVSLNYIVDYIIKENEPKWSLNPSIHVSTISGRRWNRDKNRCEFRIKNSWGASCTSYMSDIECIKEAGSYWVSEKRL